MADSSLPMTDPGDSETPADDPEREQATPLRPLLDFMEERPSTSASDRRGTIYAKLYESGERVSERTRWSVGSSRKSCVHCSEPLPENVPFVAALCPAVVTEGIPDAAEVFERRDYCVPCFAEHAPEPLFAHWKSVLPPPPEAPKKIVNFASLRVYFDQLGAAVESEDSEDETTLSAADREELRRLRYLIGLFLVRKRALKWRENRPGVLVLECRASDTIYEVPVPRSDEELERATDAFEALFG